MQTNGSVAEGLGTGLQNRLQRFESARNLDLKPWLFELQVVRVFLMDFFTHSKLPFWLAL